MSSAQESPGQPQQGSPVVAGAAADTPAPELIHLEQELTEVQRERDDGRRSPQSYAAWAQTFRADLDATMPRVTPTAVNDILHARILSRLGDSDQASASLDRALKADASNPDLKAAKSAVLYDRKDYDAAEAQADAVLKTDPSNPIALQVKHAITAPRAPGVKLPSSPWDAVSAPQISASGGGPPDDSSIHFSPTAKTGLKTSEVPPVATEQPAPRSNSLPLWPLTIPLGVGLIGYGIAGSRGTYASEDGLNPNAEASAADQARNRWRNTAVTGVVCLGVAAAVFGPPAWTAATEFFAAMPAAPALTPAMAGAGGAGAGAGAAAIDSTVAANGVKAAVTTVVLIHGAKTIYDHISYAKSESSGANSGDSDAYNTAKNGGRHSGTLSNYQEKSTAELQRAEKSYLRQVELHQQKLRDPGQFVENWDNMRPQERSSLLKHWGEDVKRNQELADIMRGMLKERGL